MDDEMTEEMAWQETDGDFIASDDPHYEEFACDQEYEDNEYEEDNEQEEEQ